MDEIMRGEYASVCHGAMRTEFALPGNEIRFELPQPKLREPFANSSQSNRASAQRLGVHLPGRSVSGGLVKCNAELSGPDLQQPLRLNCGVKVKVALRNAGQVQPRRSRSSPEDKPMYIVNCQNHRINAEAR